MEGQYYEVYFSFGSNVGDRVSNIQTALVFLNEAGVKLKRCSSMFETEPWGNAEQEKFLNCVAWMETILPPRELMNEILSIETKMGRQRKAKWEPRIIDIDILFYADRIVNEDGLVIPHPEMHKRKFVLEPLAEIVADFVHPVIENSVRELLAECNDELSVTRV